MKRFYVCLSILLFMSNLAFAAGNDSKKSDKTKTIAILGSSVAAGWVTSYETKYDMKNGYAYRLGRLLKDRGYEIKNISIPGDDTKKVLARFEKDLLPLNPDYVIIGLSMSNEGLEKNNPDSVFQSYKTGLKEIIHKCRNNNIIPIVGLCYANNNYSEIHYQYIKKMNLLINSWDVPGINFLGANEDGFGRFPEGFTYDDDHPDNRGHEEMFYSIVPGLFSPDESGEKNFQRDNKTNFMTIKRKKGFIFALCRIWTKESFTTIKRKISKIPLSFIPDDVIHSFALVYKFRTSSHGAIGSIISQNTSSTINLSKDGKLNYFSSERNLNINRKLNDKKWHTIVISHKHLQGETQLFIDGELVGQTDEKLVPKHFIIGGNGNESDIESPKKTDYKEILIYRSSLNSDEVKALQEGKKLKASLEIYAPLIKEKLKTNKPVCNRAQSSSQLIAYPTKLDEKLTIIENKIKLTDQIRKEEFVITDAKQPIKVDPKIFDSYVGDFQVAPGFIIQITTENDILYANADNQGASELFAESETEFFIKFPLAEITITFARDENNEVNEIILNMGGRKSPAKRIIVGQ